MPGKRVAVVDPTRPLQVNVANQSPHVVAYKIWVKRPNTDWADVGEGQTADDKPDFHTTGPCPKGTVLDYWFGIGGNPLTAWSALVTLSQDAHIVEGGLCGETGTTDADGVDLRETEVTFI